MLIHEVNILAVGTLYVECATTHKQQNIHCHRYFESFKIHNVSTQDLSCQLHIEKV